MDLNNTAVFEMLDNETIRDLVNYAGGLKIEAKADSLKIVDFMTMNLILLI